MYSQLNAELESYHFEADKQQLLHRFKFGILLHYAGPRVLLDVKDLKPAREAPDILQQKLAKEVTLGRMGGPFDIILFLTLRICTVGQVLPKDENVRLIHHLCYPDCDSVIYFIDPDICNVNYISIDQAVSMIQLMGQVALLLAKTDLKSAFRLLPIYPEDFEC